MLQARGSKSSVSRYVRSCRRCWNLEGPDATLDTRLSYRDGCSIMSTCSTCRPLQLNRSPDYPMTHNARYPPRLYARSYTYTRTYVHRAHANAHRRTRALSRSPLLPRSSSFSCTLVQLLPSLPLCAQPFAHHYHHHHHHRHNYHHHHRRRRTGCRYAASRTIVAL